MSSYTDDSLVHTLERERQMIWKSHPTDEARRTAWDQRRAQVLAYLNNDFIPRSPQQVRSESDLTLAHRSQITAIVGCQFSVFLHGPLTLD